VNKADWSTYHNVSKHVLQPLKDELDGMVDSFNGGVNGAQSTINAMATALSRSLNCCALAAIPKTKPREMLISDQQRHVNELLKVAQRKERTLANARRKVKRTHLLPRTPAIDRVLLRQSHSLNQARASYAAAVKAFRQASDRVTQASWDACCSRIESAPPGKAFREFKKTIAANRRKLACVTQHVDDELPSSTVESLNNFGSYYASVFSTGPLPDWNATGPPAPPSIPTDRNDLDHLVHVVANGDHHLSPCELDGNISISDVEHAMSSVRAGTAPGPDGLHVPFITKAAPIIKEVLRIIFQFSFDHGVVPVGWKQANAFTIFKKGNISDPSSYRLISITSVVIRMLERIWNYRVTNFLESSKFFSPNQAGFRRNLSTMDNIYKLQRQVYAHLRRGKQLPVLFLDVVKAFDRVPHEHLLYKLFKAGITGKSWGWMRAFLADRQFSSVQVF
jgi:hypothetical protein